MSKAAIESEAAIIDLIEFSAELNDKQNNEFQCQKCNYVNTSTDGFRRHNAYAHEGWPLCSKKNDMETVVVYVCSLCLRQYTCVEDLRGHMIEFHKYRPIVKKQATEIFEDSVLIATVGNNVTSPMKVEQTCSETDVQEDPLAMLRIRPVPFKDFKLILRRNMLLGCTVAKNCFYKFETQFKLELHERCHKANTIRYFTCTECGVELENWRRCSIHLWKTHGIDVDLMQCPLCSFRAAASVLIWRHMRNHKKWRAKVLKSMKAARKKQPTAVEINQVFPEEDEVSPLKEPLARSKNKYYSEKICEICSRKFANGKTLSKHVKTVHNKIKPFTCNVCGKNTARKSTLIVHMRQHTGQKPLQCKSCKFASRDPSVLKKHQMRHEKVLKHKHKCPSCSYTSIQTACFKRHIRINHPEEYKKIACELCSFVTINAEKLTAHIEDHRKGLIINYEDSMDAARSNPFKNPRKIHDKHLTNTEISSDCFLPLESVDSIPHEPALDTGGVTIPAPSEDTQFPTFLNN